ncbi:MAG: polysaccharide export protein [Aquisalinus sp.]|nr:polysaccharide export protein [Aquisalinus sp.]
MRLSVLLFALLSLAACGSMPQSGPAIGAPQPDLQVVTDDVREYTLGPGDKLRLIVFGEEDLSGEFLVDGSGIVSLPLVGEISAQGKTVREFQRSVESSLRDGYLNDPRVSAEVLNFRPFYILGEVNSPGTYPYSDSLTVLNAVAVAEGFTYRANQRVVFIRRDGATTEQQYPLTSTTPVRPGDTIRIAERIF